MKRLVPKIFALGIVAVFMVSLMPVGLFEAPTQDVLTDVLEEDSLDS